MKAPIHDEHDNATSNPVAYSYTTLFYGTATVQLLYQDLLAEHIMSHMSEWDDVSSMPLIWSVQGYPQLFTSVIYM